MPLQQATGGGFRAPATTLSGRIADFHLPEALPDHSAGPLP
jgi:hypothetical protein